MENKDVSSSIVNLKNLNKDISNCNLEHQSNESTNNNENLLKYAIRGHGINKSFSRRKYFLFKSTHKILDDLNINVPKGKM
jgi:hypothetical protein